MTFNSERALQMFNVTWRVAIVLVGLGVSVTTMTFRGQVAAAVSENAKLDDKKLDAVRFVNDSMRRSLRDTLLFIELDGLKRDVGDIKRILCAGSNTPGCR